MLILNSTANLVHRTPLPPKITREQAIALLRDHDFLIHLDPELSSYTPSDPPAQGANPATKYYRVTDIMHTLPAGLWDSNVSFDTEMTDLENGCDWVIRAPLGIYQHSKWLIENALETDGGEENKLCLVEDTSITCSKLLVGTVKGKCEANWKGTHGKFVERLAATDKH